MMKEARIAANGKVGIGKTDPDTLLHLHGSSGTQKLLTFAGGSSHRNNYIGISLSDNLEMLADEDNQEMIRQSGLELMVVKKFVL